MERETGKSLGEKSASQMGSLGQHGVTPQPGQGTMHRHTCAHTLMSCTFSLMQTHPRACTTHTHRRTIRGPALQSLQAAFSFITSSDTDGWRDCPWIGFGTHSRAAKRRASPVPSRVQGPSHGRCCSAFPVWCRCSWMTTEMPEKF